MNICIYWMWQRTIIHTQVYVPIIYAWQEYEFRLGSRIMAEKDIQCTVCACVCFLWCGRQTDRQLNVDCCIYLRFWSIKNKIVGNKRTAQSKSNLIWFFFQAAIAMYCFASTSIYTTLDERMHHFHLENAKKMCKWVWTESGTGSSDVDVGACGGENEKEKKKKSQVNKSRACTGVCNVGWHCRLALSRQWQWQYQCPVISSMKEYWTPRPNYYII